MATIHRPGPASRGPAAAERLEQARAAQVGALREGASGRELARAFADAVEAVVRDVSQPAWQEVPAVQATSRALVAVGGLGRRELAPYSDLDLVLLLDQVSPAGVDPLVRSLLHPLWDLGLRANLVVHDPQSWIDAAADDLTTATAILDARALLGDAALVERVRTEAYGPGAEGNRDALLERIDAEVRERHARFGDTVFLVEPDLKFGPGGARDLAAVRWTLWLASGRFDLDSLVDASLVPRGMAQELSEAQDSILRLRSGLQLAARRGQDRLAFGYQETLPMLLGSADDETEDPELVEEIEAMMQAYYRAASAVVRYGARVRDRCRRPRGEDGPARRIDERFEIVGGRLGHDPGVDFAESPVLGLEALQIARDHGVVLRGATSDAIAEAVVAGAADSLASDAEAQRRLLDLLIEPDDVTAPSALHEAADLGLVEAVVPPFGPIRGLMQHDAHHVFTVDQHTLSSVGLLKAIARGEHNKDFSLGTALHLEVDDPTVLYLATLCHDMGKAKLGDQCETGSAIAEAVARAAELPDDHVRRCGLLVREHLTMPQLAFKRDVTDPDLLEGFAAKVGDRQTLRELYLLSLVDTASVRPGNLSSWKLTLLDELYLLTSARLRRRQVRVHRFVPRPGEPESMPGRYYSLFHHDLRRHHGEIIEGLLESGRSAKLEVTTASGALRITLAARDRPGLLAHTTAVFDDHGLEVMGADVFSAPGPPPVVLDVFRVVPKEGLEQGLDAQTLTAMEDALQRELSPGELESAPKRRHPGPRRTSSVPTDVRFEADASGRRTIVEVETRAGTDVLRRVTRAFAAEGVEILLARCWTEATRASNVFYVPELDDAARDRLSARLRTFLE